MNLISDCSLFWAAALEGQKTYDSTQGDFLWCPFPPLKQALTPSNPKSGLSDSNWALLDPKSGLSDSKASPSDPKSSLPDPNSSLSDPT